MFKIVIVSVAVLYQTAAFACAPLYHCYLKYPDTLRNGCKVDQKNQSTLAALIIDNQNAGSSEDTTADIIEYAKRCKKFGVIIK